MSAKELPSPELLRQLLRYEPETGMLFWLERPSSMFPTVRAAKTWNSRFNKKAAFSGTDTHGYRRGEIFGRGYLAHRVIWAHQTETWPTEQVDHINGDRLDNRWNNLRAATMTENMRNRRCERTSTSEYLGVSWDSNSAKWRSQIGSRYIGSFVCEIEAAKAYDAAAILLYGAFANPNFPTPLKAKAPAHSVQ